MSASVSSDNATM